MGLDPIIAKGGQMVIVMFVLIGCLFTIGTLSCGNWLTSSDGPTNLPSPSATPIATERTDTIQQNKKTTVEDALPDNSSPNTVRLKCKNAATKSDRLLCNTIIPRDLRDDSIFMDSFEITYCETDLNADGTNEVLAWESSWAGTSGGSISVLSKKRNRYKLLFETDMVWSPIILLPTSHHGWRDLAYVQAGGGARPSFVEVFHDRKSYTTVGAPDLSTSQPAGEVLIPGNWSPSVFGPVSSTP